MKELPILFNSDMIRAILDGRKTQTRRPVAPILPCTILGKSTHCHDGRYWFFPTHDNQYPKEVRYCPYGQPGDRLWVRETFATWSNGEGESGIDYHATPTCNDVDRGWKPSIHMPRWASRIQLENLVIRAERLQEITEEDAIAEGFMSRKIGSGNARTGLQTVWGLGGEYDYAPTAVVAFADLWDSIYAKPKPVRKTVNLYGPPERVITHYVSYPWEAGEKVREYRGLKWYVHGNPWVWVDEFRRIKP